MSQPNTFTDFNLSQPILAAITDLGYETPTPVQSEGIPILQAGHDLIAQAQTGTGKTAVFALPILEKLDLSEKQPQAIVLAPTRELAIQVAEAFQSYAKHLKGFHVLPIYGGQEYDRQLRALKRGVHVVVGTPGRVMDHMRRGTLVLDNIKNVVLDEADEMLRFGFLEDVEWIMGHIPHDHQSALFSATMPSSIKKVAQTYLKDQQQVSVKSKDMAATGIIQSAMLVSGKNKLEALTRYLEMEEFDGVIIFARTKTSTAELAEKLAARGYSATELNGDMSQNAREKVIKRVKSKSLDIIVATDVAARGLDVERLSHVINYDAPYDVETYVHRIGRTGRAGREGRSLLMITPREQHYLRTIERTTNQSVEVISPPTIKELRNLRVEAFIAHVIKAIGKNDLDYYRELVEKIAHQSESSELDIAAALLKIAQKDKPLQFKGEDKPLLDKGELQHQPSTRRRSPRGSSGPGRRYGGDEGRSRGGPRSGGGGGSRSRAGDNAGGSRSRDGERSGARSSGSYRPRDGDRAGSRSGGDSRSRDGDRSGARSGGGYRSRDGDRAGSRSGGESRSRDGDRSGARSSGSYRPRDGAGAGSRSGGESRSRDGDRSGVRAGGGFRSRDGDRPVTRFGGESKSRDGDRSSARAGDRFKPKTGERSGAKSGGMLSLKKKKKTAGAKVKVKKKKRKSKE